MLVLEKDLQNQRRSQMGKHTYKEMDMGEDKGRSIQSPKRLSLVFELWGENLMV